MIEDSNHANNEADSGDFFLLTPDNSILKDKGAILKQQDLVGLIEYKKKIGHLTPRGDHSLGYVLPRCDRLFLDRTSDKHAVISIIITYNDRYHLEGEFTRMYEFINVFLNRMDPWRKPSSKDTNNTIRVYHGLQYVYKYFMIDGEMFIYDLRVDFQRPEGDEVGDLWELDFE